jgi:hypothetical protein
VAIAGGVAAVAVAAFTAALVAKAIRDGEERT